MPSNKALEVLRHTYGVNSIRDIETIELPVDPFRIAEQLGIEIRKLHDGASGEAWIENGRRVISYNASESQNRQRFTVAHEIGHHVLGHFEQSPQKRFRDVSFASNVYEERDANTFAAELLVPSNTLKAMIQVAYVVSSGKLASYFGVSNDVIRYRIKNTGLLPAYV